MQAGPQHEIYRQLQARRQGTSDPWQGQTWIRPGLPISACTYPSLGLSLARQFPHRSKQVLVAHRGRPDGMGTCIFDAWKTRIPEHSIDHVQNLEATPRGTCK